MKNQKKGDQPLNDRATSKDIFTGYSFIGKAVSKETYIQHYEEYCRRCSAQ